LLLVNWEDEEKGNWGIGKLGNFKFFGKIINKK